MKKILLTFALFWVSVIWAEEGIPSHVELVTGAKQDAQFLGVKDDTVSLGGTIQGQFTVIRHPHSQEPFQEHCRRQRQRPPEPAPRSPFTGKRPRLRGTRFYASRLHRPGFNRSRFDAERFCRRRTFHRDPGRRPAYLCFV